MVEVMLYHKTVDDAFYSPRIPPGCVREDVDDGWVEKMDNAGPSTVVFDQLTHRIPTRRGHTVGNLDDLFEVCPTLPDATPGRTRDSPGEYRKVARQNKNQSGRVEVEFYSFAYAYYDVVRAAVEVIDEHD